MTDYDPQAGRSMPRDPRPSDAATESDDRDVASALQELARMISDVDDVDHVLNQIAGFAATAVPGADGVGVTLAEQRDGAPVVLAWSATAPFVRELDHLQYDVCTEGPCLTAMDTGRPLVSGSLGSDARWRSFGSRAARMSVHSAMALPLVVRGAVVGAINIYARDRDIFTEHAIRLGEEFAGPAAVSVHNTRILHQARDDAVQLQTALKSRAMIDQAIGIMRSRSGVTSNEAFDRLRQISQAEHVKLAVIAQRVVDEAVRRAHARTATSG